MANPLYPNAFILGVQKAGTTTLDDWLSQHPDIYCYDSLKDVHLFGVLSDNDIEKKLRQEPVVYKGQPVILQSAVNYIFYPHLLKQISKQCPGAKLIVIIRNPVDRAVSAYVYFTKMLREKRQPAEALIYTPKEINEFSKDNNDFTYIEHGLYYKQIKACMDYFSADQLLILDYDDLVKYPRELVKKIFSFLGVDDSFVPDFAPKNITGEVKNKWVQENLIKQGKIKRFMVKYFIDPWMPRSKRKLLKQKMFEMNTAKKDNSPEVKKELPEEMKKIKEELVKYFIKDTEELDELLGTSFSEKWFASREIIS